MILGSDLIYSGIATHFISYNKIKEAEIAISKASGCPPPHTEKGIFILFFFKLFFVVFLNCIS